MATHTDSTSGSRASTPAPVGERLNEGLRKVAKSVSDRTSRLAGRAGRAVSGGIEQARLRTQGQKLRRQLDRTFLNLGKAVYHQHRKMKDASPFAIGDVAEELNGVERAEEAYRVNRSQLAHARARRSE